MFGGVGAIVVRFVKVWERGRICHGAFGLVTIGLLVSEPIAVFGRFWVPKFVAGVLAARWQRKR